MVSHREACYAIGVGAAFFYLRLERHAEINVSMVPPGMFGIAGTCLVRNTIITTKTLDPCQRNHREYAKTIMKYVSSRLLGGGTCNRNNC